MDTERHRVRPGEPVDLTAHPTDATEGFSGTKADARGQNDQLSERIGELQHLLYASQAAKVLIVLQGMDTSGKDSTTKRVFGAGSPLGIRVANFKRPSEVELAHEYMWRVSAQTPSTGEIVIFNRSHYEDVLVVRVENLVEPDVWARRYDHIVDFERRLVDEGTVIRKFFLHISAAEQQTRLAERLTDPTKRWKHNPGDAATSARWDDYQHAYREMLERTSTAEAPWWIVPSDRKWYRDLVVGTVVVDALEELDMHWPEAAAEPTA